MAQGSSLPAGFEDLEAFVAEWGDLETQDQRYLRRQNLPMARLQAFYDATAPRLQAIFDHLDRHPFGQQPPPAEALLLRLVMGLSEVAQAVETYGQPGVPHAPANHSVAIAGTFHA